MNLPSMRRHPLPILAGIIAFMGLPAMARAADLIINEALANEPGTQTSLEWVELMNWPDSGNGAINLAGYRFVDGNDTTSLDTNLSIPPGTFVIVARKLTGTASFESHWGNNSGAWGDVEFESFPVVTAKMALRNSNDTVTLISPEGKVSRMLWSRDSGDGVSIERIRPNHDDNPANFAFCRDTAGSTPGRQNSVFPIRGDLAIDSVHILPLQPKWSDTVAIIAYVTNVGLGTVNLARVEVYDDPPSASPDTTLGFLGPSPFLSLEESASDSVVLKWPNPSPGPHIVIARIREDGWNLNNTASAELLVRFSQPLVIITEFLANPTAGGPDEWIEISNRAGFPINMTGVCIGDSSGASPLPDSAGFIQPGEFWVLAENETAFRAHYPGFAARLLPIPSWHELNNTGDRIRLIGAAGEIIDSLSFRSTCEDNHSLERIDMSPTLSRTKFWKGSIDTSGSTPGRTNSVLPVFNDASLDSMSVAPRDPSWGQAVTIGVHLTNTGLDSATGLSVEVFEHSGLSQSVTSSQLIGTAEIPPLAESGSTIVHVMWANGVPGVHQLEGRVREDGDSTNNSFSATVIIRYTQPLVIISEYLANPTPEGPGEWIELVSEADFPLDLTLAALGDSSEVSPIPSQSRELQPGEFWVLCETESAFRRFYPQFNGVLIEIPHWRELNNNGDRIRLVGPTGEIIDSVSYRGTHDANHTAERIELTPSYSRTDQWAESVDPSGATPGQANSVRLAMAGPFRIDVTPNPIYLATGEPARIGYRMNLGERLTLKIFDRDGRLIRTMADNTPSATGAFQWDGTDNNGARIRPGPYILLARSDPEGATAKLVIVVGP